MDKRFLEGVQFGKLRVLDCISNRDSTIGYTNLKWLCICDCGKAIIVRGYNLVRGLSTSCGCSRVRKIDLLGKKFGKLTVIEPRNKGWLCECECGNRVVKTTYYLLHGPSSFVADCGEHKDSGKHVNLKINLIGKVFGDWTVIKRDMEYSGHKVRYLCRNSKGELRSQFSFYIKKLIDEEQKRISYNQDIKGKKFGRLKVISEFTNNKAKIRQVFNGEIYTSFFRKKKLYLQYRCKCDCGNETVVTSKDLLDGKRVDCGCISGLRYSSNYRYKLKKNRRKDYIDRIFGKLLVLKELKEDDVGRRFLCRCECGKEKEVYLRSLLSGTKSCGCLKSLAKKKNIRVSK